MRLGVRLNISRLVKDSVTKAVVWSHSVTLVMKHTSYCQTSYCLLTPPVSASSIYAAVVCVSGG
jgi:hypothetical protein